MFVGDVREAASFPVLLGLLDPLLGGRHEIPPDVAGAFQRVAAQKHHPRRQRRLHRDAIAWPEDGQFETAERGRIVETTPLGRVGSPVDIAQAVHFLACAPYITGQIVAVDGGRSIFI